MWNKNESLTIINVYIVVERSTDLLKWCTKSEMPKPTTICLQREREKLNIRALNISFVIDPLKQNKVSVSLSSCRSIQRHRTKRERKK